MEVYGDRRKGSGAVGIKLTGQEEQAFQGRENHREPHASREVAVAPSAPVEQEVVGSEPAPFMPSSSGFDR